MNNILFKSVFSKNYWIDASQQKKSIKVITSLALLVALQIAISTFYIPITPTLRIFATFFVVAISSCISGPVLAIAVAFVADILGFIVHPQGAYFIGYTISAMVTAFIYALFFYKTKITLIKIICAKTLVNLLVNVALGSLWNYILFSKAYIVYFSASIVKNIALLPFEILILYLVFKFVLPILYRNKLVNTNTVHIK